jgi:hypothetical protein
MPPAQRTAVKQWPHPETDRNQVATIEPVVLASQNVLERGFPDAQRPAARFSDLGLELRQRFGRPLMSFGLDG